MPRFNRVVQCLNDESQTAVHEQLRQQGLMSPTVQDLGMPACMPG